jgi:N-acetylmuramic acid 6-phosphate etherase
MFTRITEQESLYKDLDKMSTGELLRCMQQEDLKVAHAVHAVTSNLEKLIDETVRRFQDGGRLFYIGAGTSGRLGILDASECPPTYGVPHDLVCGIIAGGDEAIRRAVEGAEDDREQAWKDLCALGITVGDVVVGIAASGTTPYVIGGLQHARKNGILTACICCNPDSPVAEQADIPLEVITGPEFVTGSTRMKAGTAQKMILNRLSTAVMIRIGRVQGNRMVNMQLSNEKLTDRGTRMIVDRTGLSYEEAKKLLLEKKSVKKVLEEWHPGSEHFPSADHL